MCTGLLTVAPFLGSMKNTLAVVAFAAASFFACALAYSFWYGESAELNAQPQTPEIHRWLNWNET